ncbi:MAG: LPXTG cell wall anchor domain-containing protein [Clostridia bacterium]|nr:LPXTG cell wall anchor domain-containing protein [Clostridia bacterium]
MKKLFAVLLALTLVLSMGTMASAADGSITITNAVDGATYELYKMLSFAPSNTAGDKGVYTVVAGWENFFKSEPATNYFDYKTVDAGTENEKITVTAKTADTAVDQTLAKAAIAYAEKEGSGISATKTEKASDSTVEFTGLDYGYYAIDTSLGTLCALTNTNSKITTTEKNAKPDIDKMVKEDSTGNWGYVNDAAIDEIVEYKSTITVGVGATNYVMHDTMDKGLTFNYNSVADDKTDNDVVVKLADGKVVDAANYTVVYPATDGHTFDVKFENSFIEGLAQGTQFTVYYYAILNENAYIVTPGNKNEVYLSYGENDTWETGKHDTFTYTWKIDVEKYTMDGDNKVSLAGAEFQLLDKDGNAIKFTKVAGATVPTYKVDAEGTVTNIITDDNGKFEIVGLDEGEYALHEVNAPAGYNKLTTDKVVIITSEYDEANLTATYKINEEAPATIGVENKTGSLLPETGGIGTTIFYVVGGLLMAAAFILLVSKKRMASFA